MTTTAPISYKRHRFPPSIIAHAVWLYLLFNLLLREVEENVTTTDTAASAPNA